MNSSKNTLDIDIALSREDFSLHVQQTLSGDGVTAVFGRSGSGKTTLLRCLAGFEQGAGRIAFREHLWRDSANNIAVPAHRRAVGYMFQEPRLFSHLSVAGNLDYAERRAVKQRTKADSEETIVRARVIEAFGLSGLLERRPVQLSGGEAQRVALARTLLAQPELLLLDEPLAALDDAHKAELLPFLETLVREFDLPMLYVSHDVEEVSRLASQMLVMAAGRVEACGATHELFERLDIQEVTGRFESGVLVPARVLEHDTSWMLTTLSVAGQSLTLPLRESLTPGEEVRLRIRARDVALATQRPEGISIRNIIAGVVESVVAEPQQPFAEVIVSVSPDPDPDPDPDPNSVQARLRARITRASLDELGIVPGISIFALVKSVTFDR